MDKVVVITVTYGDRWNFLEQVIDSVLNEKFLEKLIIVDNASVNKEKIDECVCQNKDKITLIRNEKNEGSAGGFAQGISYARSVNCDYVLLLDDDNVADGAIPKFLEAVKSFDEKTILCGNRSNIGHVQDVFIHPEKYKISERTIFNVFSLEKIKKIFRFFSDKRNGNKDIQKIVEVTSFAYGGTFLPKQAIIDAPLPDKKLWTYGDDIAYSWGVLDKRYKCFACFDIHIKDIEFLFSGTSETSHLVDLLLPKVSDFRVYYRMRNAVRISLEYSKQYKITILLSLIIWYLGLLAIFFIKKRKFGWFQIKRAKLIAVAFYRGFVGDMIFFRN